MNISYDKLIQYTHYFLIGPFLLLLCYMNANNIKINKFINIILFFIASGSILFHSGCVSLKKMFEQFDFRTGIINRLPTKWFKNPTTHIINIIDNEFVPQFLTINNGDSIKWINKDDRTHAISSFSNIFNSKELNKDQTFETSFNTNGVFLYQCNNHPSHKGSITVINHTEKHTMLDFNIF